MDEGNLLNLKILNLILFKILKLIVEAFQNYFYKIKISKVPYMLPIWINQVFEWIISFIFFGTISNTGTIVETPQDWTQYLGIFKHLPIKNVQIYERWTTFLYFKTKIVLWIWIQNLWFGSGTREKPSGYTTHEITIFKYKMGYFYFWPKNDV